MNPFFHEQLYRTDSVMAKLKTYPITIYGAGALGANKDEYRNFTITLQDLMVRSLD